MSKNKEDKSNLNALSQANVKVYEIDWDRVNKMKTEAKYEYFKNLCISILDEPVVTPKLVSLDYDSYMVDSRNAKVLYEAYLHYRILRIKVREVDDEATFDIDWEGLAKLSLSQRVVFIDEIIESLQKGPIKNSFAVYDKNGYHIIDKSNKTLFIKCCDIKEQALKGIDTFAGSKKRKKTKREKVAKEGLLSKIKSKMSSNKRKTKIGKRNSSILVCYAVALAMCGFAVAENFFDISGIIGRLNNKNKDSKSDNKTELADSITNPYIQHVIDKNFVFPTKEEIEEKFEQPAQEPDTRSPREKLLDEYLEEYSLYFNLDSKKVVELARSMTEDYTKPFIDTIGNYLYDLDDDEEFAILFTYLLSKDELTYKLEDYGMTKEELKVSDEIITTDPDKELILRTGEHFGEYLGRISDILGMDKNYTLAVAYTIASMEGNPNFNETNNFDGLKDENGFITYSSPEAGIISYLINLKQYDEKNVNSLEELSSMYLTGTRENPNEAWVKSVKFFHTIISENQKDYFGTENIQTVGKILELEENGTQK